MMKREVWLKRKTALGLGVMILLALALRIYRADAKGLWLDEGFSIWIGSHSLFEGLTWIIRVDQHPPLYYSLLHFWLALGDDELIVRLFSASLGVATIPVVYRLGKRLGGSGLGLIAALMLSLSPFHVAFAQEVRMYTLLSLAGTLSIYFLVSLLSDPEAARQPVGRSLVHRWRTWRQARSSSEGVEPAVVPSADTPAHDTGFLGKSLAGLRGLQSFEHEQHFPRDLDTPELDRPPSSIATDLHWLGYVLATTAALYTHNTAVFLPLAQNLFVGLGPILSRSPKTPWRRNWLRAQGAILLLWTPWLPAFVIHSLRVYREFWIPAPTRYTVQGTIVDFSSAFLPPQLSWGTVVRPIFALLFLLGLLYWRRQPRWLVLLLLLLLVPFAGELLVSLRRPIFYTRTLIWASIPYYLILTGGIKQLRYRPFQALALLTLVVINGYSLANFYFNHEKEGWDQAAAYMAREVAPDDLLLFNATWVQIPFDYYFKRYNKPVVEHGVPVDLFDRGVLEPKMTEQDLPQLQRLVQGRQRVWLIYSHDWYTDPEKLIPSALGAELLLLDRQPFRGMEIYKYGRQGKP